MTVPIVVRALTSIVIAAPPVTTITMLASVLPVTTITVLASAPPVTTISLLTLIALVRPLPTPGLGLW